MLCFLKEFRRILQHPGNRFKILLSCRARSTFSLCILRDNKVGSIISQHKLSSEGLSSFSKTSLRIWIHPLGHISYFRGLVSYQLFSAIALVRQLPHRLILKIYMIGSKQLIQYSRQRPRKCAPTVMRILSFGLYIIFKLFKMIILHQSWNPWPANSIGSVPDTWETNKNHSDFRPRRLPTTTSQPRWLVDKVTLCVSVTN